MKKIKVLFFFSFFIFSFSFIEAQTWLWGEQGQNLIYSNNTGGLVATDKAGNAFEAGNFENAITFGSLTLNKYGFGLFLAKYNAAGLVQWAKEPVQLSIQDNTTAEAIVTDTNSNIYITGNFGDTVSFGSNTLIGNNAHASIFLAKYDSNGNTIWARQGVQASPSSGGDGNSATVDGLGNVYIAGLFLDTVSFGSKTLISYPGWEDFFIVKYDANGNVLWAKQSKRQSSNSGGEISSVVADKSGNVYVTGQFSDTLTLGPYTLTSFYYKSAPFLAKYDTGGNVLWAVKGNIISSFGGAAPYAITADGVGGLYIAGGFLDTLIFGTDTLIAPPVNDGVFLAKYDQNGAVLWAEQSSKGSYAGSYGFQLSADVNNHIYMVFGGDSTIEFNGYTFPPPRRDYEEYGCIAKLDYSGNVLCGSALTDMYFYSGNGVASDPSGKYIYTSGTLHDTAIFGFDTLSVIPGNGTQPYLARWQSCGARTEGINELKAKSEELRVFPNPFSNSTTISIDNSLSTYHYLELDDITGRTLKHLEFTGNSYTLSAEGLAKGMYFVRIFDSENNVIGASKIVIQ